MKPKHRFIRPLIIVHAENALVGGQTTLMKANQAKCAGSQAGSVSGSSAKWGASGSHQFHLGGIPRTVAARKLGSPPRDSRIDFFLIGFCRRKCRRALVGRDVTCRLRGICHVVPAFNSSLEPAYSSSLWPLLSSSSSSPSSFYSCCQGPS